MSSSNSIHLQEVVEELDLLDFPDSTAFCLLFADEATKSSSRYAVLYRHEDHPDELLVVESSSGSPGIVILPEPLPTIWPGSKLNLAWDSGDGLGRQIDGKVEQITKPQPSARELPNPLKQQLGMRVVRPAPYKPTGGIWAGW